MLLGTFEVDLSVFCIKAVKYVFASDIQHEVLHQEEKVLIPIILLKNHNEFDPFSSSTRESSYSLRLVSWLIENILKVRSMELEWIQLNEKYRKCLLRINNMK